MKLSDDAEKQKSLEVAEEARESRWEQPSFMAELFKGSLAWDRIAPYPHQSPQDKAIGDAVLACLEKCLRTHIRPEEVDRTGEVPQEALKALAKEGFFGLKIPTEYGGMGLSLINYARAMALVGSWCGSTAVWLSAHQSIGVPQPVSLFGTPEQKKHFLPRLAKGAISAFALTEPDVGSDPARMTTTATLSNEGDYYLINGEKLYCTNGPSAELLVVMAVTAPKMINGKEKKQISAFIVETNDPGFEVVHRCTFMGIRGISNGLLRFTNVKVPKENMIGKPGEGLKIALTTLNTGRLTIPAISAGAGKLCMSFLQKWANERVQWGQAVGKHQAIAEKLSFISANTYAMESVAFLVAGMADRHTEDIRLEAAMAKYFCSEVSAKIADETLQIRGGRGFETSESLRARGEEAYPVERMYRDLRINRIIEGTSEVMRLFIAREAMDVHVRYITDVMKNPKDWNPWKKALGFYAKWYPTTWIPHLRGPQTRILSKKNRTHLKNSEIIAQKLARTLFHAMATHQQGLEKKQLLLGHFADIGTLLFAMTATLSRTESLASTDPHLQTLSDFFCCQARTQIEGHFRALNKNENLVDKISTQFLSGQYNGMISTDIML